MNENTFLVLNGAQLWWSWTELNIEKEKCAHRRWVVGLSTESILQQNTCTQIHFSQVATYHWSLLSVLWGCQRILCPLVSVCRCWSGPDLLTLATSHVEHHVGALSLSVPPCSSHITVNTDLIKHPHSPPVASFPNTITWSTLGHHIRLHDCTIKFFHSKENILLLFLCLFWLNMYKFCVSLWFR